MTTMKSRLATLEADNARLRSLVRELQTRFEEVASGDYLALDDGELDGPYTDIDEAARRCTGDGFACTVLCVGERFEAMSTREEANTAYFGLDYPARLSPSALKLACDLPSLSELDAFDAYRRENRSFSSAANWD